MPGYSLLLGFFYWGDRFSQIRTDDINIDINAPYQDIYECGAFVWLNLAQQEDFTTCSATFSQS
ncbi:hypothetical protein [Nostoc sp. WHI]|uniref:hypothetical protein n=1 Tax=Nostoc sp. WHI TaxID=2650611 RepID=UPI0018C654AC|nr:hypothetical protein [Nostoc sp. WHI]MBG1266342.1 hypothetical protein [Nostoc sp. WHI]